MAGLIAPTHILELYLKSVVKVHLTMHLSTSLQSQSASNISDASNNRCVDTCSGRARCQKCEWGEVERECEEEEGESGGIGGKQEEAPRVSEVRRAASPTRTNSHSWM